MRRQDHSVLSRILASMTDNEWHRDSTIARRAGLTLPCVLRHLRWRDDLVEFRPTIYHRMEGRGSEFKRKVGALEKLKEMEETCPR